MNFLKIFIIYLIANTISFAVQTKPLITGDIYTEDKLNVMVTQKQPFFTLQLKSNASTGYSWFLREYSDYLIQPVKHSYQPAKEKMVGAPGYELWTFKMQPAAFIVPQTTIIKFIYARPWQGLDNTKQLIFRISTLS